MVYVVGYKTALLHIIQHVRKINTYLFFSNPRNDEKASKSIEQSSFSCLKFKLIIFFIISGLKTFFLLVYMTFLNATVAKLFF